MSDDDVEYQYESDGDGDAGGGMDEECAQGAALAAIQSAGGAVRGGAIVGVRGGGLHAAGMNAGARPPSHCSPLSPRLARAVTAP
jgi:hypothetical protein